MAESIGHPRPKPQHIHCKATLLAEARHVRDWLVASGSAAAAPNRLCTHARPQTKKIEIKPKPSLATRFHLFVTLGPATAALICFPTG